MWISIITHPLFYPGLFITGVLLCVISSYWFYRESNFVRNAATVEGKVIELIKNGHNDEVLWFPVVEFKDAQGKTRKFQCSGSNVVLLNGDAKPEYQIGELVAVAYDTSNPKKAKIKQWKRFLLAPLVVGFFGLLLIWAALKNFT